MAQERVSALAEAIADDADVDWAQAESSSIDATELLSVQQLRIVHAIAKASRRLAPRWGPFEIREQLGRGAFGTVYRAWDPRVGREVALKLIDPSSSTASQRSQGTIAEARLLAGVEHPNIVTVYGADIHDGRIGIWMKCLIGKTLKEILLEQGPFGASEAAHIGRMLCRALAVIHGQGFVHRDIKAQNVMRTVGGEVILMDFGGAGALTGDAGELRGSPAYLAPELLAGQPPSRQTDLYSLGVLLYHLVSGAFPVLGSSLEELRANHSGNRRALVSDVRAGLPAAFKLAIDEATAADPSGRPRSAAAMEALLDQVLVTSTNQHGSAAGRPVLLGPSPALAGPGARLVALAAQCRRAVTVAVLAAAVLTGGYASITRDAPGPPSAEPVKRVAVLPFSTLGLDSRSDYLATAVPFELTTAIGQIGGLRVVPWSFMKLVSPTEQLADLGKRTSADAVVEGTVQRFAGPSGDVIAIRVQLYQASSGILLWSESFERPLSGLLKLQAEIARQIATRFNVVILRREEMLLSRFRDEPSEAVELYLKGRTAWENYRDDFEPAIAYLRQAIAVSPSFADAHAVLADCYVLQSSFGTRTSARDAFPRAIASADRAIGLNSQLGEAYATRGFAKALLAWDWVGATADYRRAIELEPDSPTVRTSFSNFLTMTGRHEDAIVQNQLAEQRSPLSRVIARRTGWALYMARRYDEAISHLEALVALEPSYEPAVTLLARAYSMAGRHNEAVVQIRQFERGLEALAAQVYAQAGDTDTAQRLLNIATAPNATGYPAYQLAASFALLGDIDASIMYLEQAFDEHEAGLVNIAFDPRLDSIRGDPRYSPLLARMRFPQ